MKKQLAILLSLFAATTILATSCKDKGSDGDDSSITISSPADTSDVTPSYTITWMDENGSLITTTTVEEGQTPSYAYNVVDTAEWDFTFLGWATTADGEILTNIPSAVADVTYYAKVSAVKQTYTVTFDCTGGTSVAPQTVTYGEKATPPTAPTYEGYKFVGWATTENGDTLVDFNTPITSNTTYYAVWNKLVDVKGLLKTLLSGYQLDPLSYLPETMRFDYSANTINASDIITNYSNSVSTSNITYGFGEQWQMVLENMQESERFFTVLSVVDTLSAVSISEFNNYFDKNPANTANHTFTNSIYNVTIDFDGDLLYYILDYTATLPLFGEQTVQIALSLNVNTGERVGRVQIGDANALTYKIGENSYEFAIKYLGIRSAMFSITKDENNNFNGHIYEYLTVKDVTISSAADFYITEDYVSVVGNKADGMALFDNYICEVYNAANGKMLGYEVKETKTVLGQAIEFNTLWFNLDDIAGINTIKYIEPVSLDDSAKVYINNSSKVWEAKKVGGISAKTASRRFDIEMRTQYVYSYDATSGNYVANKVSVPMLFVQEENFDTLISDVQATNNVAITVLVTNADIATITVNYAEFIPAFIANKDAITAELIIAYIGNKIILG